MDEGKLSREWRGISPEDRIATRRAALLEAGLADVTSRGADSVSITGICATAGLTQRYFYESFRNKDEFLAAVLDATVLRARGVVMDALEDAPTESAPSLVARVVDVFTDHLVADPRRPDLMFLQTRNHPVLGRRANELAGEFIAPMSLALSMPPFNLDESDRDALDVELTAHSVFGAMYQLYTAWVSGAIDIAPDRLAAHITATIENCLADSTARHEDG